MRIMKSSEVCYEDRIGKCTQNAWPNAWHRQDYSNITVSQTIVLCVKPVVKEKRVEVSIRIFLVSEVDHGGKVTLKG